MSTLFFRTSYILPNMLKINTNSDFHFGLLNALYPLSIDFQELPELNHPVGYNTYVDGLNVHYHTLGESFNKLLQMDAR